MRKDHYRMRATARENSVGEGAQRVRSAHCARGIGNAGSCSVNTFSTTLVVALAASGCDVTLTGEQRAAAEPAQPHDKAPPAAAARAHGAAKRAQPPSRRDGTGAQSRTLTAIGAPALCVTKGKVSESRRVDVPTFRAIVPGHAGDAAAMKVIVHGSTETSRALASGQERRQVGLKLRAQDGCNLVYVMWRLDPRPKLEVSVKRNAGERTAKECGADGYIKVKPSRTKPLPSLIDASEHELRAEITGSALVATVDGETVWEGTLPTAAAELSGPAGVRSDNLSLDLLSLAVESRDAAADDVMPTCVTDESD